MITQKGYSKDSTIMPEGIVVTFGKEMMEEQGGAKRFLSNFLEQMDYDGAYWMHKCSNLPKVDVDHIYISVLGRLWGRVYCGGYKKDPKGVIGFTADEQPKTIDWNFIILAGPFERAPLRRELKGFQGFRYCTKLF